LRGEQRIKHSIATALETADREARRRDKYTDRERQITALAVVSEAQVS
jgi:hypothetical protein